MTASIDPSRSEIGNAPMEARIARIEAHVDHLDANVADLRVAFARLDAKVDAFYHRLDAKIDAVEKRLDAKIEGLEQRFDAKIAGLAVKVDRHFVVLGDDRVARRRHGRSDGPRLPLALTRG